MPVGPTLTPLSALATRRTPPRVARARTLALAGLLSFSAAAPGCQSIRASAIPEAPTWANHPSHDISLLYRRSIVAPSRRQGEPYERSRPALDPSRARLFVGSSDNGLYALRAQDGATLWRFETLAPVQSEPIYDAAEDVVYFGSDDGALYKVRAVDGQLIWRFATNAEVIRPPIINGTRVYFVNANDTLIAVERDTGKRLWSRHQTPAYGMEVVGHSGLLLAHNRLYVAFSDGTVAAFDPQDGSERWIPVDLSAEAEQALGQVPEYLDVDTTPTAAAVNGAQAVLVGSYAAGVYALHAETGNQLWVNPAVRGVTDVTLWEQPPHTDAQGQRYPQRRIVIASTGTTGLWGLDPDTGEELWRRDAPAEGVHAPAFIAGAMLVTTTNRGIFLLSPLDGAVIDGIHTGLGFAAPVASFGHRAFALSNGGDLLALGVNAPKP